MGDLIAWDLAEKVAVRVGGGDPFAASYHYSSLAPDFEELTARAEALVTSSTGLVSTAGAARARVTDRAGWVHANIASFRRLLKPMTDRLEPKLSAPGIAPVSRAVAGVQVGMLLGWMSTRVLGQYDLLLIEDESPDEQDIVYYVGPNVIALEKRHAFPPREFRLWLALHEVTHRAQFTGVPWMREYFLGLVRDSVGSLEPDPRRLLDGIKRAVEIVRNGRNPLDDGILALLAAPEQAETLARVQGLMSLLEGHGDITMDRAGASAIPTAEQFSNVLRARRNAAHGLGRLVRQLIGLDAKLRQYEEGERYIEAVERAGGPALLARVWESPDHLPTLAEIRDPEQWIARIGQLMPGGAFGRA